MTKRFIQPGKALEYLAVAVLASGAMVVLGARVAILGSDAAIGDTVAAHVEGVYEYDKVAANAFVQGALVYFDAAANKLTSVSAGNTLAGYAFEAAGAGTTTMKIKLNA